MIGQKIYKTKATVHETNSKPYKLQNLSVWIWKKGTFVRRGLLEALVAIIQCIEGIANRTWLYPFCSLL